MDVLLVAAKKDKINDYTSVVTQSGRNPALVDVDVFALQNSFELNYDAEASEGSTALINIGASTTNVAILKGTTSIFWRDISVGGNHYNDAIRKELNLSLEQAESLKRGEPVTDVPPESVEPILASVNGFVGSEIQKTIDFFRNTTPGESIDRIVVAGGASRVANLQEALAQRFGVPVEPLNPFNRVHIGKGIAPEMLRVTLCEGERDPDVIVANLFRRLFPGQPWPPTEGSPLMPAWSRMVALVGRSLERPFRPHFEVVS